MDIQPASGALSTGTPGTVQQETLGQAEFLRLLTTQLTSQSPLDPMDNQAFVAQMAQFSSVSGIAEMNESIKALRTELSANRLGDAAQYVGRTALVAAADIRPEGEPVSGMIDLDRNVDALTVEIVDASGAVVRRLDLGARNAGDLAFDWDGRNASGDPAGDGPFRIAAAARNGQETASVPLYLNGRVEAVAVTGNTTTLSLSGIGDVAVDQVRALS